MRGEIRSLVGAVCVGLLWQGACSSSSDSGTPLGSSGAGGAAITGGAPTSAGGSSVGGSGGRATSGGSTSGGSLNSGGLAGNVSGGSPPETGGGSNTSGGSPPETGGGGNTSGGSGNTSGGSPPETGGTNTGGTNAGGTNTGGTNTGGANTGGASTGGSASGGAAQGIGGNAGAAGAGGTGGGASMCSPENSACSTNGTCCSSQCVDITRSIAHCGGCGLACSSAEFCGTAPSVGCQAAVIENVCKNAQMTALETTATADNAATAQLLTALTTQCPTTPTGRTVDQSATSVVETPTGKPLVGPGDLLVAAGGDAYNKLVHFVNTTRSAPIYNVDYDFRRSLDQSLVVTGSNFSADHDYLVIQTVRDPASGTLSLVAYGFDQAGTTAAAWYFANVMLPSLASYPNAWYVYEWNDQGGDHTASSATEFTLLQSGN